MSDYRLKLNPGETLAIRDAKGTTITNKGKTPIYIGKNDIMADRSQNKFLYFNVLDKNGDCERDLLVNVDFIQMISREEPGKRQSILLLQDGTKLSVLERFDDLTELLTGALD